jgi:hypothetical protein
MCKKSVLVKVMVDKFTLDHVNYISQMRFANSLGDSPGIGKP